VSAAAPALEVGPAIVEMASQQARAVAAQYRVVVRARIIRDAIAGISNEQNARHNGVHPDTVRKVRRRAAAAQSAAEALGDAPRAGRPPRISVETRATLIKIACARPTPELQKDRIRARMKESRTAKRAATKRARRARLEARHAARRERIALRNKERQQVQQARNARREAKRAERRANKALSAAQAMLATAQGDAARAAKGVPAVFSAVWTRKTLQEQLQRETGETMSLSEIGRTLCCGGLRPHRVRMWLHSPDPNFHEKVKVICGLYVDPPAGATVVCVDEKTGMQARADACPLHTEQGTVRREFEYVRHGTSTLIAAFNIQTGEVFGRCWRRNKRGIVRFLEQLAKKYPTGDVYVVWDNLNVHKGESIEAFNARHGGRFHFVYTPIHASWMNQVEIWFSLLQRRVLRYGSFDSKVDLEAAVMAFIRQWNQVERRPFRWRFRGDFVPQLPWAA
jgi:transposase